MEKQFFTFIDGETNEEHEILLSIAEYKRAETDIEYAKNLLSEAKHNNPTDINTEIIISDAVAPCPSTSSDDGTEIGVLWSDDSTKFFISLYKDHQPKLDSGKITQKLMWEKISTEMNANGYGITSKQCSTKLSSLKRMYKSIKDHNLKTGNNRKTWKYFDLLEEIFSKKPWVAPLTTASSTENEVDDKETPPLQKKRKSDKLLEDILNTREKEREERRVQHAEKMQRLDTMNNVLQNLAASFILEKKKIP